MAVREPLRFRCSAEAERCWIRTARLLASWWFDSREDFAQRRWYEDYGVRVSGIISQPMSVVEAAVSAEQALEKLREVNVRAFLLCVHQIEHPEDRWHNERGTGVADRLGLTDAAPLFEAGKEYVYAQLEDEPVMLAVMQVLR